jgi:hypothetical protein
LFHLFRIIYTSFELSGCSVCSFGAGSDGDEHKVVVVCVCGRALHDRSLIPP